MLSSVVSEGGATLGLGGRWRGWGGDVTRLVEEPLNKTGPSLQTKQKQNKIKMKREPQSPPAGVANNPHVVKSLDIFICVFLYLTECSLQAC